jgi:hypothetical protein
VVAGDEQLTGGCHVRFTPLWVDVRMVSGGRVTAPACVGNTESISLHIRCV